MPSPHLSAPRHPDYVRPVSPSEKKRGTLIAFIVLLGCASMMCCTCLGLSLLNLSRDLPERAVPTDARRPSDVADPNAPLLASREVGDAVAALEARLWDHARAGDEAAFGREFTASFRETDGVELLYALCRGQIERGEGVPSSSLSAMRAEEVNGERVWHIERKLDLRARGDRQILALTLTSEVRQGGGVAQIDDASVSIVHAKGGVMQASGWPDTYTTPSDAARFGALQASTRKAMAPFQKARACQKEMDAYLDIAVEAGVLQKAQRDVLLAQMKELCQRLEVFFTHAPTQIKFMVELASTGHITRQAQLWSQGMSYQPLSAAYEIPGKQGATRLEVGLVNVVRITPEKQRQSVLRVESLRLIRPSAHGDDALRITLPGKPAHFIAAFREAYGN